MVAFSRRCRRFVRRRDKVTLAMHGPPNSRRILVRPLTAGDGSCVKLAQRKDPPCGKKKAAKPDNRLQTDTSQHLHSTPANTCEWTVRRLRWRRRQSTAGRATMQYGLFTMPSHPPERGLFEGHRWDLQTLRWADEL